MPIDVLITCPPMLGMIDQFEEDFTRHGIKPLCPSVVQTHTEADLQRLVPGVDGWIIGDDPVTAGVLEAGQAGRLKAAVKWGIGTDNIDFDAAKRLGVPIVNTPAMFSGEVADLALGYMIGLARQSYLIDRQIRDGCWPKPCGLSLARKTVALVGFGNIGQQLAVRLHASRMRVIAYDPYTKLPTEPDGAQADDQDASQSIELAQWPDRLEEADFIVFTCALTRENRHMLNRQTLSQAKDGVRVVNVARGPLIDEVALVEALKAGTVHSAALDVFEHEPLALDSPLRGFERCVFGSHNASNTQEAVIRASHEAINRLLGLLEKAHV